MLAAERHWRERSRRSKTMEGIGARRSGAGSHQNAVVPTLRSALDTDTGGKAGDEAMPSGARLGPSPTGGSRRAAPRSPSC
jgi:hypothetical protein